MVDVALLSLGTTLGLRHADDALAELLSECGLSCRVVRVRFGASGKLRRQITAIDLVEGLAARRAARATRDARAVIVSGATTALLLPRPQVPWAVRFDSPTALNRPGWSGAWQRSRERHVFRAADVLLPWGRAAADAAAHIAPTRTIPLPVPIDSPAPGRDSSPGRRDNVPAGPAARDESSDPAGPDESSDPAGPDESSDPAGPDESSDPAGPDESSDPAGPEVLAYAGWLWKRGIDILCDAWARAAPPGVRLVIGGADRAAGLAWLDRCGIPEPPGVEWAGAVPHDEWLARVARARAFVNASRREDHGLAQLEALAAGTPLITVPSPGAYEALPIARRLQPDLVAADLSARALTAAIRAGLALPDRAGYAARAAEEMRPYRRDAVRAVLEHEVALALGLK